MKVQSVTAGITSPIPFEVLLEKMLPHFRYFAKRVLNLKVNSDNFDDVIQELSAIAYEMYLTLVRRGKAVFYTPIKNFTIQRYQDGRRFIGSNTTDMLADRTKSKGRSDVCSLSQLDENEAMLFYMVDHQSEPFDNVQFRIDFFEGWYREQSQQDQKIIRLLAIGESPCNTARQCGVSPAAITYSRRRYAKSWDKYIADDRDFMGQSA